MERQSHTQAGLTACGGYIPCIGGGTQMKTCSTFKNGVWATSHHLINPRFAGQVSWNHPRKGINISTKVLLNCELFAA